MSPIDRRINATRPLDTPADRAWRRWRDTVLGAVNKEREKVYPLITAANVDEVLKWQERRINEAMVLGTKARCD